MRRYLLFILILLIAFSSTGEIYKIYLDREFGFWAIRDATNISNHIANYRSDKDVKINTGDTIIWENADSNFDKVTLVSGSWNRTLPYSREYKETFNSSGTYNFRIAENTRTNFSEAINDSYNYIDSNGDIIQYYTNTTGPVVHEFFSHSQNIVVSGPQIGNVTHLNYSSGSGLSGVPDMNTTLNSTGWKMFVKAVKDGNITPYKDVVQQAKVIPTVNPATVSTMQSYQEFTIYEVLKRWYAILIGG